MGAAGCRRGLGVGGAAYLMHERVEVDVDVVGSDGAAGSEGARKTLFKPAAILWDTHAARTQPTAASLGPPARLTSELLQYIARLP